MTKILWSAALFHGAGVLACPEEASSEDLGLSRRTAIVRAVERVQPSVVSVFVAYREKVLSRYRDPFFSFFPRVYIEERLHNFGGSGLIVSKDGYVLTNDHVVRTRRPDRITVSLIDGRNFEAEYVDSDLSFDLALLRIKGEELPVAPQGKSDDILVGEWVIAIGNPFNLGGSVSAGVVSAVNRDFPEPGDSYKYLDMIQTDAAINQGNSGGPLVNAMGEVIGINSFIFTENDQSVGSIGIGFAIPIGTARNFVEEVRKHGKVRTPWFGARLQSLSKLLAEYLDLATTNGALVVDVQVESPAYVAGLKRGDVIVEIDGETIADRPHAISLLRGYRVDSACSIVVIRGGERQALRLRFTERPASSSRRF